MGIKQVLSVPRSPWQRAYIERVIGTIRRECLDHMIVFNERCLYRHLQSFITYYDLLSSESHAFGIGERQPGVPTDPTSHLGADHRDPGSGGLHHRYERRPA